MSTTARDCGALSRVWLVRRVRLGIRFDGSATLLGTADDAAIREASTADAGRHVAAASGPGIRMPDSTLTGFVGAARRMRVSAGGAVFAAFRETGAARFFAAPLHELFGRTLALDDVAPRADVPRISRGHRRISAPVLPA